MNRPSRSTNDRATCGGFVGRRVVRDDHLEIPECLARDGLETLREERAAVVDRNADRDLRSRVGHARIDEAVKAADRTRARCSRRAHWLRWGNGREPLGRPTAMGPRSARPGALKYHRLVDSRRVRRLVTPRRAAILVPMITAAFALTLAADGVAPDRSTAVAPSARRRTAHPAFSHSSTPRRPEGLSRRRRVSIGRR